MNAVQKEELRLLIELDRICTIHEIKYQIGFGTLLGAIRHQGFIPWDDDVDVVMLRSEYDRFVSVVDRELDPSIFFQSKDTDVDYYHAFAKLRSNTMMLREKSTAHLSAHEGVWLDIFPMDALADDAKKRTAQIKGTKRYHQLISAFYYTFVSTDKKSLKGFIQLIMCNFNRVFRRFNVLVPYFYDKREKLILSESTSSSQEMACLVENTSLSTYEKNIVSKASLLNSISHQFEGYNFPIPYDFHDVLTRTYGDYLQLPPLEEQVSNHFIIN